VRNVCDAGGGRHVFFIRPFRAVVHQGGKAFAEAKDVLIKVGAMIEMQNNGDISLGGSRLDQRGGKCEPRVTNSALAHLEDDGRTLFYGGLDDALRLLHVVGIECADGKVSLKSCLKHFLAGYE
jgi:hypothetical protein